MTRYIAESLPAHTAIADWPHRPATDEDNAMSAPYLVATGPGEAMVRHALAMDLITSTVGMSAERQKVYFAASTAIVDGVDAVQISGRVYRIRTQES